MAFVQKSRPDDEHILVIPGAENGLKRDGRCRTYSIRSPLVSRSTQYRALLNLRALEEIITCEKPDLIECGDPYQVGWKSVRIGAAQRIPVVAFYHSHFVEAYLRRPAQRFGKRGAEMLMSAARAYVRNFYNRFDATMIPSAGLEKVLREWGVANTRRADLGVNTEVFRPSDSAESVRDKLEIPKGRTLLLYVGRLAPEKNTSLLFAAFSLLVRRKADKFHLLVIGDGQEREKLRELQEAVGGSITWLRYCTDSHELAEYYRAADLFVHPGVEETFGLVALESQACGTPVVGIRGTYMDDVIQHDQSAWATAPTAVALTEAIERMSGQDLASLGKTASALVAERYAWPRVFERLFSIYREVGAGYRKA